MKLLIWRLMFRIFLVSGFYGLWSRLYRWIWESKYKDTPMPLVNSIEELDLILRGMVWRVDGLKELGDAMSSPQAVWAKYKNNQPVGDCDDFAAFITNTILVNQARWGRFSEISDAKIMSVTWIDGLTIGGHNVALLKNNENKVGVMDYRFPDWFDTLEEAQDYILNKYSKGKVRCGWAISDPVSLKILNWGF